LFALGDHVVEFAVRYACHLVRIAEISGRDGKFICFIALPVSSCTVAILTMCPVNPSARLNFFRRNWKGIAQSFGFRGGRPAAERKQHHTDAGRGDQ
jgi:hypothetical protein